MGSHEPTARTLAIRMASLLVPAAAGLCASAILLVDYLKPGPVFCDPDGGCARLKETAYAAWLGVPTPAYGVAGFLAIALLAMQRGAIARGFLALAATCAAVVGALLLSVQAGAHTWCPFCCVADVSSLLACAAAWWRATKEWEPPGAYSMRSAALVASVAPALVALSVGVVKAPRPAAASGVPRCIASELASGPPGKVTVVDFVDFECPFCRMAHAALSPVLAAHKDKVRLVRKQVPLERIHPHALDAARAACCGEQLGKGDEMADALFRAAPDQLTPDGCAKLAASLGLDPGTFRQCVQDPKTDARIQADQAAFKEAHGVGLPTLWIGDQKIEGAQPGDAFEKAIARAIEKRG